MKDQRLPSEMLSLKHLFQSTFLLLCLALLIVGASIYHDLGKVSWSWFQRSGTAIALLGGIMTYRSIVRDGIKGVGSGNPALLPGTIVGSNEDGTVKFECNEEAKTFLIQNFYDRLSGFIGAWLIILGTLISGYGDLIGSLVQK